MILTFYKKKWELRSSSYQFLQSQVLHIERNWSLEYHADFRQLDVASYLVSKPAI